LLSQGKAQAILTYNIFESGGNVVVQTSGSLNLTGAVSNEEISVLLSQLEESLRLLRFFALAQK